MTIGFAWVTDIPAPYRNHQFERMAEIFPRYGIDLHVHFMAWTEHRRPWKFAPGDLRYPWTLHHNPIAALEQRAIHVNPGLVVDLRRASVDVVMVGGWASPSHVAVPFLLPRRIVKILGCESHLDSVARTHRVATAVKRRVVQAYDAFLVTGGRARALLCSLDPGAAPKPWVQLPNVIDAALFRERVAVLRANRSALRAALGVPEDRQLWFCPARLAPEKGLLEFLPALSKVPGVEMLIAGDGPQRSELQMLIERQGLPARLLGQQPADRVLELYAAADVFVLPSISDPSPLSAVEATAARLPLLLSRRAGNCDELVIDGANGWVLDVNAGERRHELLSRVAATPPSELLAMGTRSGELYAQRFDSDTCVTRLAEFIVELHGRRGHRAAST